MVDNEDGRGSEGGEGVGSMIVRREMSRDGARGEGGCGSSALRRGGLEREEEEDQWE